MKLKAVLFDLDGTLLPMDQRTFEHTYMKLLAAALSPRGYDPKTLIDAVWKGTGAMLKNNGERSNEAAFWDTFTGILGGQVRADIPYFDEFYRTDFNKAQAVSKMNPKASALVKRLKAAGLQVVLATNPVFPAVATEARMRWAGLDAADFDLYTTYESADCCKPNPRYYRAVAERLGVQPEECAMIGNDADDDMAAADVGMRVFLLTDYLVNDKNADISVYPQGDFDAMTAWIEAEAEK